MTSHPREKSASRSDEQQAVEAATSNLSDIIHADHEDKAAIAGVMRAGDAGSTDDDDAEEWMIEVGTDVIGACGHKVGEVVAVRDDYVVVEKGFFMPTDFYIPKSAIQRNNDHGLYLNVTKAEALHHGWDVEPVARAS